MYTETISNALWQLLKRLDGFPELKIAYLGGGTALALQLGHRSSDDLDFFLPEDFNIQALLREFGKQDMTITVLAQTSRHTELIVQSLKVDLIEEQIPLTRPTRSIHREIRNLNMADAVDIGCIVLNNMIDSIIKTLKKYAIDHGTKYRAAWNRYKAGKIPSAFKDEQ